MVEPLEARIAPAAVFTFADVDGDTVRVSSSKGTNADLATATHLTAGQLTMLDLSHTTWGNVFAGAAISVAVTHFGATGDGVVNVGYINANGIDLYSLSVNGDVGKIDAGVSGKALSAYAVHVQSIGEHGAATGGGDLASSFASGIGELAIQGNLLDANIFVSGRVGALAIGGSVSGDPSGTNGAISLQAFGFVSIGGGVLGDAFLSLGSGGSITVGGSVSATLDAGNVGAVRIGGDIVGGASDLNGYVHFGNVASFSLGGSLLGGNATQAGLLGMNFAGPVRIGGSVLGGSASNTGHLFAASASSITIGGDVIGTGQDDTGFIQAGRVGILKIGGSVEGSGGSNSGAVEVTSAGGITVGGNLEFATISADGTPTPKTVAQTMVLNSLIVDGSVDHSIIVAGDFATQKVQIGAVSVLGNWTASDLVVGAFNYGSDGTPGGTGAAADNVNFGDTHDSMIDFLAVKPVIVAKVASIIIGGQINGTTGGTDHFGFVAQQVGFFEASGVVVPVKNIEYTQIGNTGDVTITR